MSENHVSKNEPEESNITPDEIILQWFLQPGNFARYLKADGRLKHSTGSKGAMALQVIEQLEASGNDAPEKNVMILRLTAWQRTLIKAHQLATSGSYDEQTIRRTCSYYYRVVDILGPVIDNMPGGSTSMDHITSRHTTTSSTPIPDILASPLEHQTTPSYIRPLSYRTRSIQGGHRILYLPSPWRSSIDSQQSSESNHPIVHYHNQPLSGSGRDQQVQSHSNSGSNDPQDIHVEQNTNSTSPSHQQIVQLLYQQNQELVEQQRRMHRIQEMESQATLIKEMKAVGFSNEEILQTLNRLHDNGNN